MKILWLRSCDTFAYFEMAHYKKHTHANAHIFKHSSTYVIISIYILVFTVQFFFLLSNTNEFNVIMSFKCDSIPNATVQTHCI